MGIYPILLLGLSIRGRIAWIAVGTRPTDQVRWYMSRTIKPRDNQTAARTRKAEAIDRRAIKRASEWRDVAIDTDYADVEWQLVYLPRLLGYPYSQAGQYD